MRTPAFTPTEVEVRFLVKSATQSDHRTRVYQVASCQKIAHCAIILTQGDSKYIVVVNRKKGMYLVPYKRYLWILSRNKIRGSYKTISLGTAPVCLSQLSWFIDRPQFKVSRLWEDMVWWFFGRFVSKTYQPMTCALALSYVLRICGYKLSLHITPHALYKEIKDGVDNHFWSSKGG